MLLSHYKAPNSWEKIEVPQEDQVLSLLEDLHQKRVTPVFNGPLIGSDAIGSGSGYISSRAYKIQAADLTVSQTKQLVSFRISPPQ